MNKAILNIIEQSKKSHNTKSGLFLEKYIKYYNMPVNDKYVLYESFNGQGIIGNPYGLFKAWIKRKDFSDYTHVWVLDGFDEKWFQILEYSIYSNVIFVKYGSDEYLKYLSIAKYLINNCTFPPYFTKKDEQIYINTWHGIAYKKLGYDVPNSKLLLGNTIRNFLSANYILSANEHMTDVYKNSYKLDGIYEGKIIEEGQPRSELSFTNRKYVLEKLKSFGIEIEENKKIILYAPSWSGTLSNPKEINYQDVIKCIDTKKYQLLIKPHHVNYSKKKQYMSSAMDANELLSICDVLITDYSSIAYDAMEIGKPVIFYLPNNDIYMKEHGAYFQWENNVAYNTDTLRVYLNHFENLTITPISCKICSEKILNIILDNAKGNVITCNNNKIKLLFYIGDFKPNGVTTSFMSLIKSIDYKKFDVSVLVLSKKDEWYSDVIESIDSNVRVLCRTGTYSQTLLEECAKDITLQLGIGTDYLYNLLPRDMYKREFKRCFGMSKFDKLINFTGYSPFYSYFFINADGEKIIWQHNDMIADMNRETDGKKTLYDSLKTVFSTYPYYDKLVSVSKPVMYINMKNFKNIDKEKFYCAHNTLDYNRVLKLSEIDNGIYVDKTKINFINNSRLSFAKNHENLIKAFNAFSKENPNCELYLVGDGELRDSLEKIAGEHVHFVGYQSNPFYIMKQCDYFIFPSIYEGQGISLLEARTLNLPIIVSDLPKMKGIFIGHGQYNIGGFSEKHIYDGLCAAIKNQIPTRVFDAKRYNDESYEEFEKIIDYRR